MRLLKLRVGTALSDVVATYEIPYGEIGRAPNGHEEPGQQWLDVSGTLPNGRRGGLSVLNDAKYGFDVLAGTVGITAVRSPIYAWHDPGGAGGRTPSKRYQDQGHQRFRYALLPTRNGRHRTPSSTTCSCQTHGRSVRHLRPLAPGTATLLE